MKYFCTDVRLSKHIDHYWIVSSSDAVFGKIGKLFAYPGVKPEIIIPLKGDYKMWYRGKVEKICKARLYPHIRERALIDFSNLEAFVIVQFKPRSIAAMMPFLKIKADLLINEGLFYAEEIYGEQFKLLVDKLKQLQFSQMPAVLDEFFNAAYDISQEGFITELAGSLESNPSIAHLKQLTNYSTSTLERYFKKETGMTPKKYINLHRYKFAVEEIYDSGNSDWLHYVEKYRFFDQSHFIKEIKRYTGLTPGQLLRTPGLHEFRPEKL